MCRMQLPELSLQQLPTVLVVGIFAAAAVIALSAVFKCMFSTTCVQMFVQAFAVCVAVRVAMGLNLDPVIAYCDNELKPFIAKFERG